jgi:hypothetical protein
MHVVFADESIDFDGFSPASRPLDGPEKAVANLATALAMRGHDVTVFNRCSTPVTAFAVRWEPMNGVRPSDADALIAVRHPRLLDFVPNAKCRLLWMTGRADPFDADTRQQLDRHRPRVVLMSVAQRDAWSDAAALETAIIAPGIAPSYLDEAPMAPQEPVHALVTAHPLAGLDWLLKLWTDKIYPEVPGAELHLYSRRFWRPRAQRAIKA